jgi:alkanesulfonate monooxygenase SsuD/methylene tetrahydromethanopterin reductase-like flavin-dependent oxidoreductase (luciferase family)
MGYTYVPFLVSFEVARELFDFYRQGAAEAGRTVTPDKLGFLICAVTADTKARALEAGRHFVWRMGPTLRGPVEYFAPVGMRSRAASRFALRARSVSLSKMSYEELVESHYIVATRPIGWRSVSCTSIGSWASGTCCSRPRSRAWTTPPP